MPKTFAYKAKTRTGDPLAGTLLAENETAAAAYIRSQGNYVIHLKEVRGQRQIKEFLATLRPIKTQDLAIFCRQFSTMLDAGLSMVVCLDILVDQTVNPKLKGAMMDVYKQVQEGSSLSHAMQEHPGVFPAIMVSMISAGEVGGVLDVVLNRLAVHFEKEHKLNEKVKSAMTYPAIVIAMAVLAVTFILTFVMPTFLQLFQNMNSELPLPTRVLLQVSGFLNNHLIALAASIIIVMYALFVLYKSPDVRLKLDPVILQLPVFGLLIRKIAIARFTRTLSTLTRGGVPIISALDVVKRTTANVSMIAAITVAQESIKQGLGLANPLKESRVFTPMVVQMIAIGEETGELDKMLDKVADFYESDVDDMVNRLSSLLEPILIGVLGVIIGLIVIAVVLPLFDIVTNIR